MNNKITMLILTYDGFSELWEPLICVYRRLWSNTPSKIMITNNEITIDGLQCAYSNIANEKSWSDNLYRSLEKIDTEYVFCVFDDCFPRKNINFNDVDKLIEECIGRNFDYMRLHNSPNNGHYYNSRLNKLDGDLEYKTSLNFTVVKVSVLKKLLNLKENAWEYEKNSIARAEEYKEFYVVSKKVIYYYNLVVKGRYNPLVKKKIESDFGIELKIWKIKVMSKKEVIKRRLHEILYRLKRVIMDKLK